MASRYVNGVAAPCLSEKLYCCAYDNDFSNFLPFLFVAVGYYGAEKDWTTFITYTELIIITNTLRGAFITASWRR